LLFRLIKASYYQYFFLQIIDAAFQFIYLDSQGKECTIF
jgi:hypothetical protein